jgi:hypothetical protein
MTANAGSEKVQGGMVLGLIVGAAARFEKKDVEFCEDLLVKYHEDLGLVRARRADIQNRRACPPVHSMTLVLMNSNCRWLKWPLKDLIGLTSGCS